ncbi:MAG: biotin/lipoyl-binding protein [Chloroflexi bacterium]|nr:biotin/lipoyl-binding protein [Chloroflexota bacterium]
MNKKRLLLGFLLLVAVLLIAAGQPGGAPETAVAVAAAAPAAQSTGALVNAEGQVVPLFNVDLAFQMGGRVAEILVREGDTVKAGDALIRLDTIEADLALQQAQARLTSAQATVTLAENQKRWPKPPFRRPNRKSPLPRPIWRW